MAINGQHEGHYCDGNVVYFDWVKISMFVVIVI